MYFTKKCQQIQAILTTFIEYIKNAISVDFLFSDYGKYSVYIKHKYKLLW